MKTRPGRGACVRRRQPTLFERRAPTPPTVEGREAVSEIIDALAEMLLEASRASQSARSAGGSDDESKDHV